jgi:hypothetical protein
LPVIVSLIAVIAAVVGMAVLLYRLAWSPWCFRIAVSTGVARDHRVDVAGRRGVQRVCADDRAPQWPSVLVVVGAVAAWPMDRYRFVDRLARRR